MSVVQENVSLSSYSQCVRGQCLKNHHINSYTCSYNLVSVSQATFSFCLSVSVEHCYSHMVILGITFHQNEASISPYVRFCLFQDKLMLWRSYHDIKIEYLHEFKLDTHKPYRVENWLGFAPSFSSFHIPTT